MSDKPRRKYPSDHRPYFRVLDDILDDSDLNELCLTHQAILFRLWAMLNRGDHREGRIQLSDQGVKRLTKRSRIWKAIEDLKSISSSRICIYTSRGDIHTLTVPKWPYVQGFAPSNSGETPAKPSYSTSITKGSKKVVKKSKNLKTADEVLKIDSIFTRLRVMDQDLVLDFGGRASRFWSDVFYDLIQAERTKSLTVRKVGLFLGRLEKIEIEYVIEGLKVYLKGKRFREGKGFPYAAKICRNLYDEGKTRAKTPERNRRPSTDPLAP